MKKIIKLDNGMFFIKELRDFVDTELVKYYSTKKNKDLSITLKLYDKDRKLVRPHGK